MQKYSINELKNIVSPIAEKYGVEKVTLFGSYARGDYNEKSDIDLLIDRGRLRGFFALGGLYNDLRDALNCEVDVVTRGSLDQKFLDGIKRDEVVLYAW